MSYIEMRCTCVTDRNGVVPPFCNTCQIRRQAQFQAATRVATWSTQTHPDFSAPWRKPEYVGRHRKAA